jgi:6-pyruvoyltetrahydropterin/6-carboxytetrahydropterin synthase
MSKYSYEEWMKQNPVEVTLDALEGLRKIGIDATSEVDAAMRKEYEGYLNYRPAISYTYTSTKEYHDAFPCAYRQWRADSHCQFVHGYSFSMKFYFGTNDLDARNWAADYGGLKELKKFLEDQFDHTLIVAQDDPELETFKLMQEKKIAKIVILPALGCESLADQLYKYVNGVYIPEMWGPGEAKRLWCYRVEVRETQSNMAFREGHREWKEDLFA